MKMLNAYTLEVDDPNIALEDLLTQLDLEHQLQKNAAGFISCSYDFIESGMLEHICRALPFDTVGCTTLTNAMDGQADTMMLCISVLTADDCSFATAASPCLTDDLPGATSALWKQVCSQLPDSPQLVLTFLPMLGELGGEIILEALDAAAGHSTPIFGTVGCDYDTALYSNTFTFHNGEYMRDRLSVLVISGNVKPRFVVVNTLDNNLPTQQALITSSTGSLLKEVDGLPTSEYLRGLGLMPGQGIEGLSAIPFLVNYGDGTPAVARAIYSLNDDGSAICGGAMPEGATLSVGILNEGEVLLTAESGINTLLQSEEINAIILFPCLGRNMVLMRNPLAEAEKMHEIIAGKHPWHMAYSGGEICPVFNEQGTNVNRFHNYTFVACAI